MTNADDISLDEWLEEALCAGFSADGVKFLDHDIPLSCLSKRCKKEIIFALRILESIGLAQEYVDGDLDASWSSTEFLQDLMESRDKMKKETS